MSNMRGLSDLNKDSDKDKKKKKGNYAGGTSSGMETENPGETSELIKLAEGGGVQKDDRDGEEIEMRVTLYKNGFTVDKGEFRDYKTPENEKFIAEMNKSQVPREIMDDYRKKNPNAKKPPLFGFAIADKRSEDYRPPTPPPEPKYVAFSGSGVSMGGGQQQAETGAVNTNTSDGKPAVDESKPKTQVRIRLHNGQTVTLDLNLDHTVGDIHQYVMTVAFASNYSLVAGFPPKPLEDATATIEQAKLVKAMITQRLS